MPFEELSEFAKKVDLAKSLIYGIHEVTVLPPEKYEKVLAIRDQLRKNPFMSGTDSKLKVESYVVKDFQTRYNAFLLFMLNNSHDEILMTFTEFCRRVFPAGLP